MIFPYTVKYNGVIYRTGENVPMESETAKDVVSELKSEQTEPIINDNSDPFIVQTKRRGRRKK